MKHHIFELRGERDKDTIDHRRYMYTQILSSSEIKAWKDSDQYWPILANIGVIVELVINFVTKKVTIATVWPAKNTLNFPLGKCHM